MAAKDNISAVFLTRASDVLADTDKGMTGPEITRVMRAHAIDAGVEIPHGA